MNDAFTTLFVGNLEDLVRDLQFEHKPTEFKKAPVIFKTQLPERPQDYKEAGEYPFVCWSIHKGVFSWKTPAPFNVRIDAAIYTSGTTEDGSKDIEILCMALGKIVEKPWYKPYRLMNSVPFYIGSSERNSQGVQPHPYYWASLHLEFKVANGHGG